MKIGKEIINYPIQILSVYAKVKIAQKTGMTPDMLELRRDCIKNTKIGIRLYLKSFYYNIKSLLKL